MGKVKTTFQNRLAKHFSYKVVLKIKSDEPMQVKAPLTISMWSWLAKIIKLYELSISMTPETF